MGPGIDNLVVTLVGGDETHIIVVGNLLDLALSLLYDSFLLNRNDDIVEVERQTGYIRHVVTQVLDTVKEGAGASHTDCLDNAGDDATE